MIPALIAFALWLPALIGHGSLSWHLLRIKGVASPVNTLLLYFSGLALVAALANTLNFVIPLSPLVSLCVLAGGWLAFAAHYRQIRHILILARRRFIVGTILLLLWCVVAPQRGPQENLDYGIYHLQTIKWLTQSHIPWGIANLDGDFANNSAWHSAAALLELPFMQQKSGLFMNGLLVFVHGLTIFALLSRPSKTSTDLFWLGTVLIWPAFIQFPSVSPDMPVILLTLLCVYCLLRAEEDKCAADFNLQIACLLSCFATMVKLSAFPLLLVVLVAGWHCGRARLQRLSIFLLWSGGVWLTRNMLLSGCLLYPVSVTCLPVGNWAISPQTADLGASWVRAFSRSPGAGLTVLQDNRWIVSWLHDSVHSYMIAIPLTLIVMGCAARLTHGRDQFSQMQKVCLTLMVIAVCFWIVSAPEPRFAYGYLVALGLLVSAESLMAWLPRSLSYLGIVAALSVGFIAVIVRWPGFPINITTWGDIPRTPLETKTVLIQTTIYLPITTDRCWDAPLPCTPSLEPNLRVQRDGNDQIKMFYLANSNSSN